MTTKYGAVYDRRGKLILHADAKTTAGVMIGIEPYVVLEKAATDPSELGRVLREVLGHSKTNLRHPESHEWAAVAAPLYAAAGAKSWGVFVKGAELTSVEADGTVIRLAPQENRGAREGFQPMGLPTVEIPAAASDAELGRAVLEALEIARSAGA